MTGSVSESQPSSSEFSPSPLEQERTERFLLLEKILQELVGYPWEYCPLSCQLQYPHQHRFPTTNSLEFAGRHLRSPGMAQDSTEIEQPVGLPTLGQSSVLPIGHCAVELSLNSVIEGSLLQRKSLIVVPTFKEGIGIYRRVSAQLSSIASQELSNGE